MLFICYPKCSTCKKAKKFLDDNNVSYEERDIKTNNPSYEELLNYYKRSNLPIKKFINTSGLLYRSMDLKNKIPSMTDEDILKLLSSDGMLVKRPLLISDDYIITGFKEDEYKRAINL